MFSPQSWWLSLLADPGPTPAPQAHPSFWETSAAGATIALVGVAITFIANVKIARDGRRAALADKLRDAAADVLVLRESMVEQQRSVFFAARLRIEATALQAGWLVGQGALAGHLEPPPKQPAYPYGQSAETDVKYAEKKQKFEETKQKFDEAKQKFEEAKSEYYAHCDDITRKLVLVRLVTNDQRILATVQSLERLTNRENRGKFIKLSSTSSDLSDLRNLTDETSGAFNALEVAVRAVRNT